MAWEHVLDGIFAEKVLPVASRQLEGHGVEQRSSADLEQSSAQEPIVRRPVKLQKRVQFQDIDHLVKPIMNGIPSLVWGGWGFVNRSASLLFIASRETRTPLHKDGFHSMIIQLNGTKHWTLIPDRAKHNMEELLFRPKEDVRQRRGPLLLEEPMRSRLGAHSCLLQPFEVMYMPENYWHDVYSLTAGASLSVRYEGAFEQVLAQTRAAESR